MRRSGGKGLFSKERIVIDFSEKYKDLPVILGRVNYARAHQPLEEHVHIRAMEIVLLEKGSQVYTVGGTDYTVNSGQVFVTFPDERHSSGRYPEDKALLYYLILDPYSVNRELIGYRREGFELAEALTGMGKRVFDGCPELKSYLDRIILASGGACRFPETASPQHAFGISDMCNGMRKGKQESARK